MKHLYLVRYEVELMVMAESPSEAEHDIRNSRHDWTDDMSGGEATATAVMELKDVPLEWKSSIPWGEDDDRTCEDILSDLDEDESA